jgi:hypothetical protein
MVSLLVGIITGVLVCLMIMGLCASAKGEDELREKSCQDYHS